MVESCESDEENEDEEGIVGRGVRLSEVMVMGRQKREESVVKVLKASWSSGVTALSVLVYRISV